MSQAKRKRAPTPTYVSPNQLSLDAFASPFASRLKSTNRWVVLGDLIPWDAFNEGSHMVEYVEKYKVRFGCYPRELLADKIYCTRFNRAWLKEKGIKLIAKPLGRPSAVQNHVSPGERNPIEGKFGQAKTAYRLDRIKARLQNTSESWIASIILVLNLVKLAGATLPCTLLKWLNSFSARGVKMDINQIAEEILNKLSLFVDSLNPVTIARKI